jgi:hypothetical protein
VADREQADEHDRPHQIELFFDGERPQVHKERAPIAPLYDTLGAHRFQL